MRTSADNDSLYGRVRSFARRLAAPLVGLLLCCLLDPLPARGQEPFYPTGGQSPFWGRTEYLLWYVERFSTPPLLTTSPADTDEDVAGVLGEPNTGLLIGNGAPGAWPRPGARTSLGYWFDPGRRFGIQGSYAAVWRDTWRSSVESQGDPILARPFLNVEPGSEGQDAELLAFEDLWEGSTEVTRETSFQGADVLLRSNVYRNPWRHLDFLMGWRFNRLNDCLSIADFITAVGPETGMVEGTTIDRLDRFETSNSFNGGELGLVAETRRGDWTLEILAKVALGNTHSRVEISGLTTTTVPMPDADPDVAVTPAGLLAQETNIGVYEKDDFAVIPELGLTLGYDLGPGVRLTLGYSVLYWSEVARPGGAVDLGLNLSQLEVGGLVGPERPGFAWVGDDVWVHGVLLGLDWRY